jgi:hypothetical protein
MHLHAIPTAEGTVKVAVEHSEATFLGMKVQLRSWHGLCVTHRVRGGGRSHSRTRLHFKFPGNREKKRDF